MIRKIFCVLFFNFVAAAACELPTVVSRGVDTSQSKISVAVVVVHSETFCECRMAFGRSQKEASSKISLKAGEFVKFFELGYDQKDGYYTIIGGWVYTSASERVYIVGFGAGEDQKSALNEARKLLKDAYKSVLKAAGCKIGFVDGDFWYDIPYFFLQRPTEYSIRFKPLVEQDITQ